MQRKISTSALAVATCVALAACAPVPPKPHYGYNDPYAGRSQTCATCGVIEDVARVYVNDNSTTGGGAVLGAIIGGVLGSTVGGGRGRTAATVGGAVAGGFAGNAIERSSGSGSGRPAWQFHVRLDDGRYATVTQWDSGNLRPGDRVMIRDNHLVRLR